MTQRRSRNRSGARIVRHVWTGAYPFGSIDESLLGIKVTSPLFTLLTMARSVSIDRLTMAMYEMCGSFSVFKLSQAMKAALDQAQRQKLLDPSSGWVNVKDSQGKATNIWKRDPLISLEDLASYPDQIRGLPGSKAFARAARSVTGITASPLEVQASMLLGLNRARGGEGLSIKNNVEIRLTNAARSISGTDKRYADIQIYNRDNTKVCIVECQGKAIHGSIESMVSDSDRTTALQVMGLPVVLATHSQLVDPQKFRHVMRLVAKYLDMDLKPKTPAQRVREDDLRREIFTDWTTF